MKGKVNMKACVRFTHPKPYNCGCEMRAEMHYQTDSGPGYVRFGFSNQKESGFDAEGAIAIDLRFDGVAELISVLCGKADSAESGGGGGAWMRASRMTGGFLFEASEGNARSSITLVPSEAEGLKCALEGAMFFLAFVKGVNT